VVSSKAPTPTPYPELNAILRELTASVQAILADDPIGLYLQGSFATGDFDRHSDADFIVVLQRALTDGEVTALNTMHARLYHLDNPWAPHLEGSYFPRAVLRNPSACGQPLWFLDHGSHALIWSAHCNTLVVRWVLREHGIALVGPDAAALIDPFSTEDLRREIAADMRQWGADILAEPERRNSHFYQTFIVLSYCRMLHSLDTGKILSKRAGAAWAKAHLDPAWHGLIDRAWVGRQDPAVSARRPADPADFQATLDFIRYAIEQIPRYGTRADPSPA